MPHKRTNGTSKSSDRQRVLSDCARNFGSNIKNVLKETETVWDFSTGGRDMK